MGYKLFLDDERVPYSSGEWVVVRSSQQAIQYVSEHGLPTEMSLDHDLGFLSVLKHPDGVQVPVEDTTMTFLKWLSRTYWDGEAPIPAYNIHSANFVGRNNIQAYMESWKRSVEFGG